MAKPRPKITKRKSRRKIGARSYKNYSPEMLEIAVEAVTNKTISSRDAEKQFGIPRRTILNKLKNCHSKAVGAPTRLTIDEESQLINVIKASADYGSPLTKLDVRIMVHNYLKKNGKEDLFNGKMPGEKWINNFLARHNENLTLRITQNISSSRAQKGEEEILNYFENLRNTLSGIPASNIINYDETNCSDDPGAIKAIFRRGVKYPERILNSTKGCVSIMFSGTADGNCLAPYIVYKAENLYNEWVLGGPDNARYNCTRSGWFDSGMFEDYFKTVVLGWAKNITGPKAMIGDNLSSHLSPDIINLCEEHDIRFVFLPPNSTHLTQPLDIAFFGPLKKEWRKILLQYKIENPNQKTLNKKHFPALLKKLMENIDVQNKQNLQSGFRAAGIYPLNPRQVLKRIPEFEFPDSTSYQIDEALLDYLKQTRAPNPTKFVRNKKIYTEPGKSVSAMDFQKQDLCQKPKATKVNINCGGNASNEIKEYKEENHNKKDKKKKGNMETKEEHTISKQPKHEKGSDRQEKHAEKGSKGKGIGKKTKTALKQSKPILEDCIESSTGQISNIIVNKSEEASLKLTGVKYSKKNFVTESEGNRLSKNPYEKKSDLESNEKKETIANEKEMGNKAEQSSQKECIIQLLSTGIEGLPKKDDFRQIYSNDEAPLDIVNLPLYCQEAYIIEEITVNNSDLTEYLPCDDDKISRKFTKKETKENKIKITSNTAVNFDKLPLRGDMIKISPKTKLTVNKQKAPKTIKTKRPSYYRNEEEILKDLMNDDLFLD